MSIQWQTMPTDLAVMESDSKGVRNALLSSGGAACWLACYSDHLTTASGTLSQLSQAVDQSPWGCDVVCCITMTTTPYRYVCARLRLYSKHAALSPMVTACDSRQQHHQAGTDRQQQHSLVLVFLFLFRLYARYLMGISNALY